MKCTLCKKSIANYDLRFNHLDIDESTSVEICSICIDKFMTWQQGVYANLFPTKLAKKRYENKKEQSLKND